MTPEDNMSSLAHLPFVTLSLSSLLTVFGSVAAAQPPAGPDSTVVAVTATIDTANQYMFRGVRQNATGAVLWPAAKVGVRLYSGQGRVKGVLLSGSTFNSLHTGDTGSEGPTGQTWYESDGSGAVQLVFGRGISLETSFTADTSPNDLFTTSKEVAVRFAVDDPSSANRAVRPYALAAFEVDTAMGVGQLDGGLRPGTYLELGVVPDVVRGARVTVTAPVRVGLSLDDYYELATEDHAFGLFSVGAMATVPIVRSSQLGTWAVQGGVEYQALGATPKAFNGGDGSAVIWRIGLAFGTRP
jgi:hypothetical protein